MLLLLSVSVAAHHSPFLYFNPAETVVVEGEIIGHKWRNPHAEFMLLVEDASGNKVEWVLETHSVSILSRMNLSKDDVKIGEKVRVAGWPSQRGGHELFITNMLMPDGEEVVFDAGSKPIWSDERVGDGSSWLITEDGITANIYSDIFHVWSTSLVGGDGNLLFENYDFKLTNSAAKARDEFDMFNHPIIGTCVIKGMPTIMEQPYPMQFAKGHDVIIMHMEEGNVVRTFDMSEEADYSAAEPTTLGHSTGVWDNGNLIVKTIKANWQWVDLTGVPNSPDSVITETFTPTKDGRRLDYKMVIDNPNVFSESPTFSKSWLAVSGERVSPYNCEEG